MKSLAKTLNKIFNIDYWKEYRDYIKTKNVLIQFFKEEDSELQKSFNVNFDYPEQMVQEPVRFVEETGDLYYTINFKSREMFLSAETKEKALTNSLAILDKYLPLGVTQNLVPQESIHIPNTFSILCSLSIQTDITTESTIWNIVGSIFKPISIISTFLLLISIIVKYLQ